MTKICDSPFIIIFKFLLQNKILYGKIKSLHKTKYLYNHCEYFFGKNAGSLLLAIDCN